MAFSLQGEGIRDTLGPRPRGTIGLRRGETDNELSFSVLSV
jgi:hypothetical protein